MIKVSLAAAGDWIRFGNRLIFATFGGAALVWYCIYRAYYDGVPDRDVWAAFHEWRTTERHDYVLYSGTAEGTYDRLAREMAQKVQTIRVTAQRTEGSVDNAVLVNSSRRAFAFITEPLVPGLYQAQGPPVQRVAPLYMQKVFFAYQKSDWRKFAAEHCGPNPGNLSFTGDKSSCAYRYLAQASWDAGPARGGAQLILNHLLRAAELRPRLVKNSGGFRDQADNVRTGAVQIAFNFAGDNNRVVQLVREPATAHGGAPLGIGGVDPQLGIALRSIELRPDFLRDEEGHDVPTIGAYAVLVASADVPAQDIATVVLGATDFVKDMTGTGTHLQNVAAELQARAQGRNAQFFVVAEQLAAIYLSLAALLLISTKTIFSLLRRKKIVKRHVALRHAIRLCRESTAAATVVLDELRWLARDLDAEVTLAERSLADGRLSVSHKSQIDGSAAVVDGELQRQARYRFAALVPAEALDHRDWMLRHGYLDPAAALPPE